MNELQQYIEARNAETKARAEAEGYQMLFTTVSDPAHWAEAGIYTVAQYKRQSNIDQYIDMYKDTHGIKPRWVDFDSLSDEDIISMLESLYKEFEAAEEAARIRKEEAVVEFEATVQSTIDSGAGDRDTALRWLFEAADVRGDVSYFEYQHDLPYGYLVKEMA